MHNCIKNCIFCNEIKVNMQIKDELLAQRILDDPYSQLTKELGLLICSIDYQGIIRRQVLELVSSLRSILDSVSS